jgi:hypothetical protein
MSMIEAVFKRSVIAILLTVAIILSMFSTSSRVHAQSEPNLALNISRSGYPTVSASYTCCSDNAWYAVDGSYSANRWTNYGSPTPGGTDSFTIDFGSDKLFNQVKLYIYNDTGGVKPPASYTIQYLNGGNWIEATSQTKTPETPTAVRYIGTPTPDSILNTVNFDTVTSPKLRVIFKNQSGSFSGVVELEVFLLDPIADQNAAAIIISDIQTLPPVESIVLSDKTNIAAARTAYTSLTPYQQNMVTNLSKLTDAEAAIATLVAVDVSAADAVMTTIGLLPIQPNVTLSNKPAIEAARSAYVSLTASQQDLVTNLSKLTVAEATIAELEAADVSAADAVITTIGLLPIQADVTLSNKSAIETARSAYVSLTASQQDLVTNLSRLTLAEATITELELALIPVMKNITVLSAFSNATGNLITLKLSSVLDITYSMPSTKFAIIANEASFSVVSADYDSTDYSHSTIKLTLATPALFNVTTSTISIQNGTLKTNNNELNNAIHPTKVITFENLDLSHDNRFGVDDLVQMISNPASQIDVNQNGFFNNEDILILLDQISVH